MGTNLFDRRMALFLAAVCGQTYIQFDNKDGTHVVPKAYQVTTAFKAKSYDGKPALFGFILESDEQVVVAFRGTVTAFDWIADAIANQKKFRYVPGAGWTHEGFTDIYSSVRDTILSDLKKLSPQKTLHITGHSLGGALATLCAVDAAANSHFPSPVVYTFGAPRVGDPAFVKAYGSRIACSHRVYNELDLVPHLPPILYRSPKSEGLYRYLHVKNGFPLRFANSSISANHVIGSYFSALAKLAPPFAHDMCQKNPGFCPVDLGGD
jgi:triacylglycerol lipase